MRSRQRRPRAWAAMHLSHHRESAPHRNSHSHSHSLPPAPHAQPCTSGSPPPWDWQVLRVQQAGAACRWQCACLTACCPHNLPRLPGGTCPSSPRCPAHRPRRAAAASVEVAPPPPPRPPHRPPRPRPPRPPQQTARPPRWRPAAGRPTSGPTRQPLTSRGSRRWPPRSAQPGSWRGAWQRRSRCGAATRLDAGRSGCGMLQQRHAGGHSTGSKDWRGADTPTLTRRRHWRLMWMTPPARSPAPTPRRRQQLRPGTLRAPTRSHAPSTGQRRGASS